MLGSMDGQCVSQARHRVKYLWKTKNWSESANAADETVLGSNVFCIEHGSRLSGHCS
jgi:hypothetical protein